MLAHILRTDQSAHRPLPADSELAQAIAVLARAQQDAVWDRQQLGNRLRSLLLNYYPAAVTAFAGLNHGGLTRADARAILALAPSPAAAATLTRRQLLTALRRAGRVRLVHADVELLHRLFRAEQMRLSAVVEAAFARQLRALLRQLDAACATQDELTTAVEQAFAQHPDAPVLTSFPGVGLLVGARLLAEIGDDRDRFTDARALKAYAGSAPVTRASGRSTAVSARRIKNQRLAATGYVWAFAALRPSTGARAHYDRRRATGPTHRGAPQPHQPPPRLPAPLPPNRQPLHRATSVPAAGRRRLTAQRHRMSGASIASNPPRSRGPRSVFRPRPTYVSSKPDHAS